MNAKIFFSALPLLTVSVLLPVKASALGLEDFLSQVLDHHKMAQSLTTSKSAAEARGVAQDLELSPVLTLSSSYLDDKKTNATSPTYIINHLEQRTTSLGLAKKFTTGTQAQVTGTAQQLNTDYLNSGVGGAGQIGIGSLGLSLSQSLWRDSFGSGTRSRLERQHLLAELEKQNYDLQLQQLLVDAEASYWDLLYEKNEIQLRTSSLERARRIETWVRNRFANGIGDRADVLNAQGLLATRELQLISAQDDLKAAERKVADLIGVAATSDLPVFSGELGGLRQMNGYLRGEVSWPGASSQKKNQVLRLDSYLAALESKAKSLAVNEVEESLKPDVSLQGSYQTNALDDSALSAFNKANKTDKPTAYVGVSLTWLLDGEVKSASRQAAKMDALAAVQKFEQKLIDSESSWSELDRRHSELSKKIEIATRISQVQLEKAAAEREKLSKGRTITSQVITAEQDAAEAELVLAKLKAEQRKLEAQGRLFIKVSEL